MGLIDGVKTWLVTVALKKAVARAVMAILAILTSAKIAGVLAAWGITIDAAALELSLTAAVMGALEFVRNFIKVKTGTKILG